MRNHRYSYTKLRQMMVRGSRSFYADAMTAARRLNSEKNKSETLSRAVAELTTRAAR